MNGVAVLAGLKVSSEFALPGLQPLPPSRDDRSPAEPVTPDVVIVRGTVDASLPNARILGPTMQMAERRLLITVPRVARFLLQDGQTITVDLEEGVPDSDVGIFLIGTVFGMLLHQRGCVVLHASAVEVDGGAVLFCGVSGAGKSTLAAALSERGYGFISDDICAIARADGLSVVRSDCRHLKLWDDAIVRLELGERRHQSVRSSIEKYYVTPPRPTLADAVPVRALYLLRKTQSDEAISMAPLGVLDALTQIRLNAYRPRLQAAFTKQQGYLDECAALVRQAQVFAMKRPWGLGRLDVVIGALESHWQSDPGRHG